MSTSTYDTFVSPLAARNASEQMLALWSPRHKFNTWRRIWLAVARAQNALGLPVSAEQLAELEKAVGQGISDEEIRLAEKYERELRHDVMAHVHALGDSCPKAKGIVHLGMTSQDVVCNGDLLTIHAARALIALKIDRLIIAFGEAASKWKSLPTLGFTHYQPAQPVTVGRRIAGWAADLHETRADDGELLLRGLRGATGTQASYLALLDNDGAKVDELESRVVGELRGQMGIASAGQQTFRLQGQTYPRCFDAQLLGNIACVASVLHKIATDIRLLCNRKEIDEPFEDKQIGSSAMPYKRNPMRCERVCGLARFVMNLPGNALDTAATQWLERTLDDSSNRRLSLPEAFLALDGALDIMHNVASGLVVHEATVKRNLMAELPFMATENMLMECVKLGGDRQEYHEHIRRHAQEAGLRVKQEAMENDLISRLEADKAFWSHSRGGPLRAELNFAGLMDPARYIGRSAEQTERFLAEVVEPLKSRRGAEIERLGQTRLKV